MHKTDPNCRLRVAVIYTNRVYIIAASALKSQSHNLPGVLRMGLALCILLSGECKIGQSGQQSFSVYDLTTTINFQTSN